MPASRYVPKKRHDRNACGRIVAKLRTQQDLSQQDLAGRLAAVRWIVSRDVIKRIESGEREVTDIELKVLAKALRVPVAVLFEP
jgi:transcriptional regulator with XRE-family HTH domain